MRFSIICVVLIMAGVLVSAVFVTDFLRTATFESGNNIALVLLRTRDTEGLQAAFDEEDGSLLSRLQARGVSFRHLNAASTWYPANTASILSGLYPSQHGLHRSHAYLSREVSTLGERLSSCGFRTYALVGEDSLLPATNVLKDFNLVESRDPRETITTFLSFHDRLPDYRNFFCLLEVDLDVLGGPRNLDTVLDNLYTGLGREAFLEKGVLAILAPDAPWPDQPRNQEDHDPRVLGLMAGDPLKIGPGKCMLKAVSLCEMNHVLLDLALDQGFSLRDAIRTGTPVVTETAASYPDLAVWEQTPPPPQFYRSLDFDDTACRYLVSCNGSFRMAGSALEAGALGPEPEATLHARYELYLNRLILAEDCNIPQDAGPLLTAGLALELGEAWSRPDLMGASLHAVEHFRLAEAFCDLGYPSLAVSELNSALFIDRTFPEAQFLLARAYAALDPASARKQFQKFIDLYGGLPDYGEKVKEAQRYLHPAGR